MGNGDVVYGGNDFLSASTDVLGPSNSYEPNLTTSAVANGILPPFFRSHSIVVTPLESRSRGTHHHVVLREDRILCDDSPYGLL